MTCYEYQEIPDREWIAESQRAEAYSINRFDQSALKLQEYTRFFAEMEIVIADSMLFSAP